MPLISRIPMQFFRVFHRPSVNALEKVEEYSSQKPFPISLTQLLNIAENMNLKESYKLTRREIPVRLAAAVKEITLLPVVFQSSDALKVVMKKYVKNFQKFLPFQSFEPESSCIYEDFLQIVNELLLDDCNVVEVMAQAQADMRRHTVSDHQEIIIQWFLDRFFLSRISVRMLCHQYSKMHEFEIPSVHNDHFCGAINKNLNIVAVVKEAANDAREIFKKHFDNIPQYTVSVKNTVNPEDECICLPYVNSHLHYIIYELTKNALRAVIEKYTPMGEELPDLNFEIIKGKQNVIIILSDYGDGISFDNLPHIFRYMHTTVEKNTQDECNISSKDPYAGLGYGLPLSRLYARYLNGDILISSIRGHGTKAYLFLNAQTENVMEVLPIINTNVLNYYSHFSNLSTDPS